METDNLQFCGVLSPMKTKTRLNKKECWALTGFVDDLETLNQPPAAYYFSSNTPPAHEFGF